MQVTHAVSDRDVAVHRQLGRQRLLAEGAGHQSASPHSSRDYIDAPGKARWYKFNVKPGQRIQVALSGLPADYDLAVFKDIGAAFSSSSCRPTPPS